MMNKDNKNDKIAFDKEKVKKNKKNIFFIVYDIGSAYKSNSVASVIFKFTKSPVFK